MTCSRNTTRLIGLGLLTVVLSSLTACGSETIKEPPRSIKEARRLETRADRDAAGSKHQEAVENNLQALRLYSLGDDREGQLRSHLSLVRLFLLLDDNDRTAEHLQQSLSIARELQDRAYLYQTHLLAGRVRNDPRQWNTALAYAATPVEQAVVLTYLRRYEAALDLVEDRQPASSAETEDYAFVVYQYAYHRKNVEAADRALALFKESDNPPRISDTLYLLARFALDSGNRSGALSYLRRALAVNRALGDDERTRIIQSEIDKLL